MILRIRWLRVVSCLAASVTLFGACAAFAQSTVEDLYAITADKKLLRVDVETGAGTLVATLSVEGTLYGLASMKLGHGESAELWMVTTSNRLYRVDPYSGKLLMTNLISLPAASGGGLAWRHFFSGDIFIAQTLNSTGTLIRMDLFAGTSVVVGALSPPMEGLETSYDGNLFGLSAGSSPSFYRIDRTNGATTLIGSLGISLPGFPFGALAMYGGLPGETYAVMSSVNESRLYQLDASGAAIFRGQIGFPRVAGIAFHVRRPGPLSIRRVGTNVLVSWPETNGGYLWRRTNITSFGSPVFNTTFPATNRFEMFYLSPHPPF
jgi:hypothetical protein